MSLKHMGVPDRCPHGEYADKPCDKCEIERLRARVDELEREACLERLDKNCTKFDNARLRQLLFASIWSEAKAGG